MAEPCVQLAQRLAANDKKSRDRALRKLRLYLTARSGHSQGGFTADELCKIWKGLFYCMWMQDKPLLQEELALMMSQLVHALQTRPSQILFLRCFWQTVNREWNGIDRLRLDKFYMLLRLVLRQSLELLKAGAWEMSLVQDFLSILEDEVLKAEAPHGVQHHLTDIYLEEVAKAGANELSADLNLKLIEPFCQTAAKAKDAILQQSVVSGIFQSILEQSPFAIEDLMKEINHTAETDSGTGEHQSENREGVGPVLQFDYQALADRLFNLASRKNTPVRNRKALYYLVKRFKDLAEGIFPMDGFPDEVSSDEDDDELSSRRYRRRKEKEGAARDPPAAPAEKGLKRGKRRRGQNPPEAAAAVKKQKKKEPVIGGDCEPQVNGAAPKHPDTGAQECTTPTSITPLRRRRRGGLLRLSLSVLPLRGSLLLRRRRKRLLQERRKMISAKTTPPVHQILPDPAPVEYSPAPKCQDFITFQKSDAPRPLYVKGAKSKGRTVTTRTSSKPKKVTFSLNKNMTAEFRRTDRSLLVSPSGSSRVPFNPSQRPPHSVLKTPTPPRNGTPRARAADFF